MKMLDAIRDRITGERESAQAKYDALVLSAAADENGGDPVTAEKTIFAAGRTLEQFAADVMTCRERMRTAAGRSVAMANGKQAVVWESQIASLQSERDEVLKLIDARISALVTRKKAADAAVLMRIGYERQLNETAPDWIDEDLAANGAELAQLRKRADWLNRQIAEADVDHSDEIANIRNDRRNRHLTPADLRQAIEEIKLAAAAAKTEAQAAKAELRQLNPKITNLLRQRDRFEQAKLLPWPLRDEIE